MPGRPRGGFARHWREIASSVLKLGVTAYGRPAIMGLMQAALQDTRPWIPNERCMEGLSWVNMLPGAGAMQLGIAAHDPRAAVGCVLCTREPCHRRRERA